MARNNLAEEQVRAIMAAQVPRARRLAEADDVIVNDAGVDALLPQVERLHLRYLDEAASLANQPSQGL
jgi:dephospho-CoA kinase